MHLSTADFRIAARTLVRQPVFATIAVLSLALAIALNTTMYSVLDGLINPRLDFRDPDQLYNVQYYGDMRRRVAQAVKDSTLLTGTRTYQSFARSKFIDQVTARYGPSFHEATVKLVDTAFYHVLGVHPIAGRVFGASDLTTQQPTAVISEALANELFPNGNAVGKTFVADLGAGGVGIESTSYTVIGVLENASQLGYADISTLPAASVLPTVPVTLLRIRPGVTQKQLESELSVLSSRLALLAGESPKDNAFNVHKTTSHQFAYRGFDVALTAAV